MKNLKEYNFKVYSFIPPEYGIKFYEIINKEKDKGDFSYKTRIEETAPPLGLIKEIIIVTASSLNIIWILYKIYNEIKKKKGKIVIRMNGKDFNLEAYDIEDLKMEIEKMEESKEK